MSFAHREARERRARRAAIEAGTHRVVGRRLRRVRPPTIWSTPPTEARVYIEHDGGSMGTISARIPDELEAELEAYLEVEHLDRSTAVRKLLAEGLAEWRRERALERLADGTVSFARAAELAEMSVWEFARLARERDVTWVDGEHLSADLDDR